MKIGTYGHDHFQLFARRWPEEKHVLAYIGHSADVPIGYIGGGPISATQARSTVEELCGYGQGPVISLALAPHDGTNGIGHNNIVTFHELPTEHTTVVADAVVIRKTGEPFAVGTFLGDCACIIVATDEYVTFMHCGTPELFAGLLDEFGPETPPKHKLEADAFLGPCISGKNYLYSASEVPERYHDFIMKCHEGDVPFDKGTSFDLRGAIAGELRRMNFDRFHRSWIDPFLENLKDNHQWASARYARYAKEYLGQGDGLSPRDLAFYTWRPSD